MAEKKKVDQNALKTMKREGRPITMVTAYDAPTARLLDEAGVDTVLVGDSLGNVVLGYADTVPVTMDEMLHHARAVRRGLSRAFLIGDMPFMSYNLSREQALQNGGRFLKEAGCDAVKLEGGGFVVDTAAFMVRAGVPIIGHLGLTPQTASSLGGYKVQGRTAESARQIVADALALEAAGALMLVLECVPAALGTLVSRKLTIPVIGIGAGAGCDGQVLVFHDLVGIRTGFAPKFVRRFAEAGQIMGSALSTYCEEVRARRFPGEEHSFSIPPEEIAALEKAIV